ncbi:hypothetical protein ABID14_000364 [Peptoniphilus olsenii]|uniref:Tetrahydrofolate dehydrogenase/cyclohydrolase NAD(P)-binding domain-containing protein n=1 Tax=Peptoniphilus olsenii TaxID=411570 RepID=A0ABV2JAE4_9FIRM
MSRLVVVYDSLIKDKQRDIYLNKIKKEITNLKIIDLRQKREIPQFNKTKDKILLLKPLGYKHARRFNYDLLADNKQVDIEGAYSNQLSITAEAIIKTLEYELFNLDKKIIMVINQSKTVGQSLVLELMRKHSNVISFNSSVTKTDLSKVVNGGKVDAIVTASGNKDFKICKSVAKNVRLIIDLSNDVDSTTDAYIIRSIPTIDILKKRLEDKNWGYKNVY